MVAVTFDTHKFVRRLKESGFNDQQAEALTDAVQETQAAADIATKADLREYESVIRNDLKKLEMRLDARFAGVDTKFASMDAKLEKAKFDLLRWMVGLAVGNFIFLAGIFWKVMTIPGAH